MTSSSANKTDLSAGEESTTDRSRAHVGVVCTHALEVDPLIGRLDRRRQYSEGGIRFSGGFLGASIRVAVVEAGAGFAAHRKATEILVKEHAPSWIIAAGLSSSLADDVLAGDLSLATTICDMHGQRLNINCPIPESRRATLRTHLVADKHPVTPDQKRQLADATSASVVDTSSLAVAQICEASGIPFLSIRAILDDVNENVPSTVIRALFESVSTPVNNPVSRWVSGLRRPKAFKVWVSRAREVTEHLDRFLLGVIRQVGDHLDRT